MSLDRQGGEIVFECECCEATFATGENEFADALRAFRNEGWIDRQVKGDWLHFCQEHVAEAKR